MKLFVLKMFCALFVCLLFLSGCGAADPDPASVVVGSQAPSFSLTSLDGTTLWFASDRIAGGGILELYTTTRACQ